MSDETALPNAMVLAAGRGERLRPITDSVPKPLVEVGGQALLDWTLDRFAESGVDAVVVNIHHLGEQIAKHLENRDQPRITLSPEPERLDTGGGVANALRACSSVLPGPRAKRGFFVSNSDVVLLDGPTPCLRRLWAGWDPAAMDVLLLLQPTVSVIGYEGLGDFFMDAAGRLTRRAEGEVAPFLFTGTQILHPRLFEDLPDGVFSLNVLYDRAARSERLWGLRHEGLMFHVGTPAALETTRRFVDSPELMNPFF